MHKLSSVQIIVCLIVCYSFIAWALWSWQGFSFYFVCCLIFIVFIYVFGKYFIIRHYISLGIYPSKGHEDIESVDRLIRTGHKKLAEICYRQIKHCSQKEARLYVKKALLNYVNTNI